MMLVKNLNTIIEKLKINNNLDINIDIINDYNINIKIDNIIYKIEHFINNKDRFSNYLYDKILVNNWIFNNDDYDLIIDFIISHFKMIKYPIKENYTNWLNYLNSYHHDISTYDNDRSIENKPTEFIIKESKKFINILNLDKFKITYINNFEGELNFYLSYNDLINNHFYITIHFIFECNYDNECYSPYLITLTDKKYDLLKYFYINNIEEFTQYINNNHIDVEIIYEKFNYKTDNYYITNV